MFCHSKTLLSLLFVLAVVSTLKVPINPNQFRCMLVYSMGSDQSIKIDMNLPKIKTWSQDDYYYITIRNTIDDDYQQQTVSYGVYRRQFNIKQELIYQVCFQLVTESTLTQQIVVDYTAETHFLLNHDKIKVPQHLLKIHEVQGTYQNAVLLSELADNFLDLQTKRYEKQQKFFQETSGTESNITFISVIQILMILAISAYQFYTVKKYLTSTPKYTDFK